ncbi:UDP-2,3-diacylglucosamine diphosphatase LpxI [Hyphococcus flavus]|uniref:UDP-2,3-diacylglucosamine diphosphatase LpxI n=1 Tax=Hyphococcus flavus TaxID=1866326 RepID=A0AAE9ZAY9_9PROT|nr:UDP-2,3-diacylglucosamine diphosphatase LpxI [Hyphococcus flavus]WDI31043.1 UDP-2,3-diacylglucosamine diphosphatase LpxI [Hyphococcus flavus]
MTSWTKLAIVSGDGRLPFYIARSCKDSGRPFHVIRLTNDANKGLLQYNGDQCSVGEVGKFFKILERENCDTVVFAGILRRPDFSALNTDLRGLSLLPKITAAAVKGDGHILNTIIKIVEAEGFQIIGAEEAINEFVVKPGAYGKVLPNKTNLKDIKKASELIAALDPYDVGQGAVVANGLVVAIEAAEGTDAMLERCATFPRSITKDGILVKRSKPSQDLRIDLPTIGAQTVCLAAKAGLAGVAVEESKALFLDQSEAIAIADQAGVFVYGCFLSEFDA